MDLEVEEEDEQGYLREGEDLNDIYSDGELEELDNHELLRLYSAPLIAVPEQSL